MSKSPRSLVAAAFLVAVIPLTSCVHHEKEVASKISLTEEPLVLDRARAWPIDGRTLDLCVEPVAGYGRASCPDGKGIMGCFVDAQGNGIDLELTPASADSRGEAMGPTSWQPSNDVTCFTVESNVDAKWTKVELRATPRLEVERIYWYRHVRK